MWLTWVPKLIPLVIGAVQAVETISKVFKSDPNDPEKGKKKQDAAVEAIGAMISSIELSVGKEIMDIPEFQVLLRKLIDDYVALQNFVGKFKTGGQ